MRRIFHTWDKWECYPAGFYGTKTPKGMTKEQCENLYVELLSDIPEFSRVLGSVISEWRNSCEHYLTNECMNRIAWLGQAALAYKHGIPAAYRGGYHKLSKEQQEDADACALAALNAWCERQGYATYTMETVKSKTQADIY